MSDRQPDGTGRINWERLTKRGIELGMWPQAHWLPETQNADVDPIQQAAFPEEQHLVLHEYYYHEPDAGEE